MKLITNIINSILIGTFILEVILVSIVQFFPREKPKYTNTNVHGILPNVV